MPALLRLPSLKGAGRRRRAALPARDRPAGRRSGRRLRPGAEGQPGRAARRCRPLPRRPCFLDDPAAPDCRSATGHAAAAKPMADAGHGRIETRTAAVPAGVGGLQEPHGWPGLAAIGKVRRIRETPTGTTAGTADHRLSAAPSPGCLNEVARSHWGIENPLHWRLDVVMNEDQDRTRLGHGPENLAVPRHMALNVVQAEPGKGSRRGKLKQAGWNDAYLTEILKLFGLLLDSGVLGPGCWAWVLPLAGVWRDVRSARGAFAIVPASGLANVPGLMDDAKRFALVRRRRRPEGACRPGCGSPPATRDGCGDPQPHRRRGRGKACACRFDDLVGTVPAGRRQRLRVRALCLCLMGSSLSNRQIAGGLGLAASDVQAMRERLRRRLAAKAPAVDLQGGLEPDARASSGIDGVHVAAGPKGQPEDAAKRRGLHGAAGWQARRRLAGAPQAGRRAGPRHVGDGQAAHPRPDPARRPSRAAHAGPRASRHGQAGHHSRRRPSRGRPSRRRPRRRRPHGRAWRPRSPAMGPRTRNGLPRPRRTRPRRGRRRLLRGPRQHDRGFWSVPRSWLRPHRGVPQDKLPLRLGFCQFVTLRRRGKALLGALTAGLLIAGLLIAGLAA